MRMSDLPASHGVQVAGPCYEAEPIGDCGFRIRQTAAVDIRRSERKPKVANCGRIVACAFESLDRFRDIPLEKKSQPGSFPVDGGEVGVEPERRLERGGCVGMIAGVQLNV